jgi:hypothetical protein
VTIANYDDGSVRMGEWGRDIITQTKNMVTWWENSPLAIQDGKITQPARISPGFLLCHRKP